MGKDPGLMAFGWVSIQLPNDHVSGNTIRPVPLSLLSSGESPAHSFERLGFL